MTFIAQEDGQEQWRAPEINGVKINTDTTLFDSPGRYSHALIVHDHSGQLVEAISRCYSGAATPEYAEAIDVREALRWVKNAKQHNVVVETNCLAVVHWIHSSFTTLSYLGRMVEDCRKLLSELQH